MKGIALLILPFLAFPAYAQQTQVWNFEYNGPSPNLCTQSADGQKFCQPVNMHQLGTYDAEIVKQPEDVATGNYICHPGSNGESPIWDCYETQVEQQAVAEPSPMDQEQDMQDEEAQQQAQQQAQAQQSPQPGIPQGVVPPQQPQQIYPGPSLPGQISALPYQTVWNFNEPDKICHTNGNCFRVVHRSMQNYSMIPTDMNVNGQYCRLISERGPEDTYFECYQ